MNPNQTLVWFLALWLALGLLIGCSDSALSELPDNFTYEPVGDTLEPFGGADSGEPAESLESVVPGVDGED